MADSERHALATPVSRRPLLILGASLLVLALLAGIFLGGNQMSPEEWQHFLAKVDVVGVTGAGKAEQSRLYQIRLLTINSEKKEVLMRRTVFIGCTPEMATLALGRPRKVVQHTGQPVPTQTWIYHFPQDTRPTMLVFQNGSLTAAYKGSALDAMLAQPALK